MAGSFYIAGLAGNGIVQAETLTPTPAEDSLFPVTNLQGQALPFQPFKHGSAAASSEVVIDLSAVDNGGFEADGDGDDPTDWTIVSGTPSVSNTQQNSGSVSLRLNADGEAASQDLLAIPGNTYTFEVALYGDGTNDINVYVIDLRTGKYRTSGGAWSLTKTAIATRSTGSWATTSVSVPIEERALNAVGGTTIRILAEKSGAGTAYLDDVRWYPNTDTLAIVDHNVPDGFTVEIHSSTDNFSASDTTESTMTVRAGRMYDVFTTSPISRRWLKLIVTELPFEAIRYGQLIVGEKVAMGRSVEVRYPLGYGLLQTPDESRAVPVALAESPTIDGSFSVGDTKSGYETNLTKLWGASKYGVEPVLLVPDDSRPELIYGRVSARFEPSLGFEKVPYELSIRSLEVPLSVP